MTNGSDPSMPCLDVGVNVPIDSNHQESIAFASDGGDFNANYPGLTKREYFAAMAMQGICANPSSTAILTALKAADMIDREVSLVAEMAVIGADALIEALNKEATR